MFLPASDWPSATSAGQGSSFLEIRNLGIAASRFPCLCTGDGAGRAAEKMCSVDSVVGYGMLLILYSVFKG